ncbi:hypothetical protein L593_06735 [Salinarchaeum sp. Harcht-Bsk1]|uniref:hypothetical protein n=1 Tax=Salinarchaeum sp. Harcht-Bsk1 TaxID=1333523 RepID=UPI0003422AB5|nr:hypothetical protein [Salinarchaeum sp. Harcht-Bsk1]AGN01294.1 hypothetical protein L593_06735 [Salinarchaeum sp. Harcht-Bsk1]
MDEILDVAELVVDSGFEEAIAWLLRIVGILCILAGIGIWLFVDVTILVPIGLIVLGLLLVAIPQVLLLFLELA